MCQVEETLDRVGLSPIKVWQAKKGYRFSTDPILLAAFARPAAEESVLDLGTGVGVIPLLLRWQQPDLRLVALELQSSLAARARRNLKENEARNVELLEGDLRNFRSLLQEKRFDLVTANPPFRSPAQGRSAPNSERNRARFEQAGRLSDFCAAASWALREGGRFCLIHLADRMADIEMAVQAEDLRLNRRCWVKPFSDKASRLVLVEAVKGATIGSVEEATLVMYQESDFQGRGTPTETLMTVYRGGSL